MVDSVVNITGIHRRHTPPHGEWPFLGNPLTELRKFELRVRCLLLRCAERLVGFYCLHFTSLRTPRSTYQINFIGELVNFCLGCLQLRASICHPACRTITSPCNPPRISGMQRRLEG